MVLHGIALFCVKFQNYKLVFSQQIQRLGYKTLSYSIVIQKMASLKVWYFEVGANHRPTK